NGKASKWTDKKIVPPECLDQYNKLKGQVMVIEMIEETFNEPFKTGPLIDQQGNYAIFDILMNQSMFGYIQKHNLQSKAGQQSKENASLKIDFPAGANKGQAAQANMPPGDPGAVMLKVSWKVLDAPAERQNFHTVDALVLMPRHPNETTKPPCLRKTLGLVGFRAQTECARAAGSGSARGEGERTVQFLQSRLRCVCGESDTADPMGANI